MTGGISGAFGAMRIKAAPAAACQQQWRLNSWIASVCFITFSETARAPSGISMVAEKNIARKKK